MSGHCTLEIFQDRTLSSPHVPTDPSYPPYRLHLVPCLTPCCQPIVICAPIDYFRAVWKASDEIDFDAGIGGRNDDNAESRRIGTHDVTK